MTFQEREDYLRDAIACSDFKRMAEAYFEKGHDLLHSDWEEKLECYRKALEVAKQINYSHVIGLAMKEIAQSRAGNESSSDSIEMMAEALKFLKESGAHGAVGGTLYMMAGYYHMAGDVNRSLELLKESISEYEKSPEPDRAAYSLLGLAVIAEDNGDLNGSTQYLLAALPLALRKVDKSAAIAVLVQLSSVNISLANFDKAEAFLDQADQLAANLIDHVEDLNGKRVSLRGRILLEKGEVDSAIKVFEHAIQLATGKDQVLEFKALLGKAYYLSGELEKAEEILLSATALCVKLNHTINLLIIYPLLSTVQKVLGKKDAAFETIEKAFDLHTKFYTEDYKKKVAAMHRLLASEREREEIRTQKLKIELFERELSNSTLQLIAQTELLGELRDGLLQFIHKFPLPDGAAKELRERLKTLPCKAVDWEKFDTQFKSAHPEFTKILLTKHPTLTPTELRMCSLLRMNLRSAEIARLLCLSERTIEHHRAHIRTKMKLKKNDDLIKILAAM